MNDIEGFKNSQSAAFKKRNPHLFESMACRDTALRAQEHDYIAAMATKTAKKKKRIRQSDKPILNALENEFGRKLLHWYHELETVQITAQSIRFSLGNGIAYKPDFVVFRSDFKTIAYECKGPYAHRGGFENLKVAANKYPLVHFMLVWKDEQGVWQEQHVLP